MIQNIPQISICGPLGMGLLRWFVQLFFFLLMSTILDTSWYGVIWTTKLNQILEQDLMIQLRWAKSQTKISD
jgi:hypothetical protein